MKFKLSEIGLPIVLVGVVLLIIIPVPNTLIDIFLSINISISMLILLITMFTSEPLEFSIFPSVLLLTTVFRLGLNISTTRGILSKADAGNVIQAFGEFVIGGDALVGFVIFLIIVIVQFLVITKGSERVSEVAARFTLDAMPGKQMAIDADLNSGLIDEATARERRSKIQRESDFYGAMDGASKFVKGDAIAGIIITVINILVGFAIGSTRMDYTMSESLSTYTLLTVGDGLVSQIPALMISVGTGIVVTRAASESNLSTDLISQFLREPIVLYIVGGILFSLAFTPLPTLPFVAIGLLFAFLGYSLRSKTKKALAAEVFQEEDAVDVETADDVRKTENIMPLLQVDPIELEFGYGIIPLADPNQGGDLFDRLVMIRRQIALEYGVIVPMIRLRDNIQLEPNEYTLKVKGSKVGGSSILFDHFLAMGPNDSQDEIEGVDTLEPAFGLPAKWISADLREEAEMLGYTVVDPSSIISTHLTEIIKKHTYELLSRQDVKSLIDNVTETNEAVVNELIPNMMSYGEVQKVLSNLLREGISIRDLVTILETLADYITATRDTNVLTEYVRQNLKRQISNEFFPEKYADVVTLSPELEDELMSAIGNGENGTYIAYDPQKTNMLISKIADNIKLLLEEGNPPIVVTVPIVRFYLKQIIEGQLADVIVLSYNEIDSDVELSSTKMVVM